MYVNVCVCARTRTPVCGEGGVCVTERDTESEREKDRKGERKILTKFKIRRIYFC